MGSGISIALWAERAPIDSALAETVDWFRLVERTLSRFDRRSELNRLNRAAGMPTRVSSILWEAIRVALAAAAATSGLVTPTMLRAVELAGYDCSFDKLPPSRDEAIACAFPVASSPVALDFQDIVLDEKERTVTLPRTIQLDLGGTAKGWAADVAAATLAQHGSAIIDAGGDVAMKGSRRGLMPWKVAVASPIRPDEMLGVVQLTEGGVATSGRNYRKWQRAGIWQHHIIDPRTRRPADTDVLSATIVGVSALAAEVAAKHVLILGSEQGMAWLHSEPALAGLVVTESGSVLESARMEQYWDRAAGARFSVGRIDQQAIQHRDTLVSQRCGPRPQRQLDSYGVLAHRKP